MCCTILGCKMWLTGFRHGVDCELPVIKCEDRQSHLGCERSGCSDPGSAVAGRPPGPLWGWQLWLQSWVPGTQVCAACGQTGLLTGDLLPVVSCFSLKTSIALAVEPSLVSGFCREHSPPSGRSSHYDSSGGWAWGAVWAFVPSLVFCLYWKL